MSQSIRAEAAPQKPSATIGDWVEGARLRTLPLSVAPVIAGSGVALWAGAFHPWRALLALVVGVAMQMGVNYANDYSDGVRGTDDKRVGPQRLVGSGLVPPVRVKLAAFACFGVGCLAGLALVIVTGLWWIVVVGVAIVVAAWFYTGGKHPYGYVGLGDVSVFIFFGVVATAGTVVVQTGTGPAWHWPVVVAAFVAQGAGACAVLVANNLRDIDNDAAAGKKTLAVRLGDRRCRAFFTLLAAVSLLASVATALLMTPWALLCLVMLFWQAPAVASVVRGDQGMRLVRALKLVSLSQLAAAIGLLAGVAVSVLFFAH